MKKNFKKLYTNIQKCKLCELYKTRTKIVFNEVSKKKSLIFLGEAPGGHEDTISGVPFSGRSGTYLLNFLNLINIDINKIYMTNLVKCRPTKFSKKFKYGKYSNRKPKIKEINSCAIYLKEEIKLIKSNLIVTLGNIPLNYFFKNIKLKNVHGNILQWKNKIIFPLYHPASIIYNKMLYEIYIYDLYKLKEYFKKI